jgi:hypothetical protein
VAAMGQPPNRLNLLDRLDTRRRKSRLSGSLSDPSLGSQLISEPTECLSSAAASKEVMLASSSRRCSFRYRRWADQKRVRAVCHPLKAPSLSLSARRAPLSGGLGHQGANNRRCSAYTYRPSICTSAGAGSSWRCCPSNASHELWDRSESCFCLASHRSHQGLDLERSASEHRGTSGHSVPRLLTRRRLE